MPASPKPVTEDELDQYNDTDPEFADAPVIRWAPAALTERGVVAVVLNLTGAFTVHWGDGGTTDSTGGGGALRHTFSSPGPYTFTAKQGGGIVAKTHAFVRDGLKPAVTFAAASDNPNIVEATFNDDPAELVSSYEVTWATGVVETFFAPKGTVRSHGYAAGTHTIVVRDLYTGRVSSTDVVVVDPTYDPDFSLAKGANATTALLTLTAVATAKDVLVDWGDGTQETIPAAKPDDKRTHPYAVAGTYIVQVLYADNSTDGSAHDVTIPFPARDKGNNRP
jgi:hypothetical protein